MAEEIKKAISELDNTDYVDNNDLLIISRINSSSSYRSYNVNVEDFLSTALSNYHDIKSWVYEIINALSSKEINDKFVHKVVDADGIYRYESIDGGKIFNEVPSCSMNPVYNDDLVRYGSMKGYVNNHMSSELSNYSKKDHNHDARYSKLGHTHSYIPLSDITQTLGTSTTKVVSQKLLSTELGKIKIDFNGPSGDVLYVTPTGSFTQQINDKILVCETAEEVVLCKNEIPSVEEIFKTWIKFGLNGRLQYIRKGESNPEIFDDGYFPTPLTDPTQPLGVRNWEYNASENKIQQLVNCADFTGYCSLQKYKDYSITIRFYSPNGDDDFNGIIGAMIQDSEGRIHTISFERTPNTTNPGTPETYHWYCELDSKFCFYCNQEVVAGYDYKQKLLKNSSLNKNNEPSGPWSTYKNFGVQMKLDRVGNKFTCYTTKFSNTKVGYIAEKLEIDLDALVKDTSIDEYYRNILNLFRNTKCHIGVFSQSQPQSYFDIVDFPVIKDIVDLPNSQVLRYNFTSKTWDILVGVTPIGYVGAGRLAYNDITQKFFYNDGSEIYNISSSNIEKIIDTKSLTDDDTHVPSSKLMKTELEAIKNKIDAQLTKLKAIV